MSAQLLRSLPSRVAAIVPRGGGRGEFRAASVLERESLRTAAPDYIAFALAAAGEALLDAGLLEGGWGRAAGGGDEDVPPLLGRKLDLRGSGIDPDRFGVAIGSGVGNVDEVGATAASLLGGDRSAGGDDAVGGGDASLSPSAAALRLISPFFVPRVLISMPAGQVAIRFGLRGPSHSASTACAAGAHSVGDAFRLIKYGDADAMLAGGTEACIGPVALAGFSRARALSTRFNDTPGEASRPFDAARDGFVLGEGAGVLVLEEMLAAQARGARIYGEVRGYGLCSDAFHVTAPRDDGSGALRCMRAALDEAGLRPEDVDYVNAHATSTPLGDAVECKGLARLFRGEAGAAGYLASRGGRGRVRVSSTKGSVGHMLGAAGAAEAIFSVLAVSSGRVPATRNLTTLDADAPVDVCDFPAQAAATLALGAVRIAMSNSFAFGGANASLLFAGISN